MSTIILRQKLHSYLEIADDKKVKDIYAIMENDIEQSAMEYTPEIKKELDNRYADYKNVKAKIVTDEESRKKIQKILKSANKK
jgi:5-methylcytosine-specific restriction endonuclease McrBC GTP-binding regulatory subunit McrB